MKPKVVAIIGSSKFKDQQLGVAQRLTLHGNIVLVTGFWHHRDMVPITDEQKERIDRLTLAKIDLAEQVHVVNVNGYVGESTKRQIAYANETLKPVHYEYGS